MTKRTGAAAIGVTSLGVTSLGVTSLVVMLLAVTFGGSASARAAGYAAVAVQHAQANDVSARRHQRPRYRYVSRPPYPDYYGRPYYYAPAPFFPIPPFFGYGWEPW
jgi:hypothetical protein